MILIALDCGLCETTAGIGMDLNHARQNVIESGGRVFGETLIVCTSCAEHTR